MCIFVCVCVLFIVVLELLFPRNALECQFWQAGLAEFISNLSQLCRFMICHPLKFFRGFQVVVDESFHGSFEKKT